MVHLLENYPSWILKTFLQNTGSNCFDFRCDARPLKHHIRRKTTGNSCHHVKMGLFQMCCRSSVMQSQLTLVSSCDCKRQMSFQIHRDEGIHRERWRIARKKPCLGHFKYPASRLSKELPGHPSRTCPSGLNPLQIRPPGPALDPIWIRCWPD